LETESSSSPANKFAVMLKEARPSMENKVIVWPFNENDVEISLRFQNVFGY
jgi:hypothetical protein